MTNISIKFHRNSLRRCGDDPLYSHLIERLLDLVEVIEVVLHRHTDGVNSMRAHQPLPGQQLIQVMLLNATSKSKSVCW